ncbi:hypothetical protein BHE74_00019983 [Ensete ventricosum]|nr:hypothetical protein GW17_00027041 [Ensete ventricosum]RWW72228.1 hypothetical protein BHE74_00019983 [Ensete ventricosum]
MASPAVVDEEIAAQIRASTIKQGIRNQNELAHLEPSLELKRRVSQGTLRRRGSASAALEEEAVKGPPRDLAKAREVARELAGGKVEKGLPWEGALSSSRPDKSIASPIQPLVSLETEFLRANAIFSHGP